MSRHYTTRSLSLDRAPQAFPLIHAAEIDLSLGQWVSYAKEHLCGIYARSDRCRGIVTIESEDAYIHGLFLYTIDHDLKLGRSLRCEHVIALDLFHGEKVAASILESIQSLAKEHDCAAISISVQIKNGPLHAMLEHAGHSKDQIVFRKPVEAFSRPILIERD